MKFDSKTIFSIFISVIMIGSIVGFTAFYSFPDQGQNPDDGSEPVLPATAINFVAKDIEVRIDQMLPTMRIQAETSETDLTAINSSIYAIEGIKRVNAGFEQSPYTLLEKGYVYVAEVSFDNDELFALHGFIKKTQKTPDGDLKLALSRRRQLGKTR